MKTESDLKADREYEEQHKKKLQELRDKAAREAEAVAAAKTSELHAKFKSAAGDVLSLLRNLVMRDVKEVRSRLAHCRAVALPAEPSSTRARQRTASGATSTGPRPRSLSAASATVTSSSTASPHLDFLNSLQKHMMSWAGHIAESCPAGSPNAETARTTLEQYFQIVLDSCAQLSEEVNGLVELVQAAKLDPIAQRGIHAVVRGSHCLWQTP